MRKILGLAVALLVAASPFVAHAANLLTLPITSAISTATTPPFKLNASPLHLTVQANFIYGSGGTTVDAYVQTSLDSGATWVDIAQFHFTTSSLRAVYNLNAQTAVTTEYTATDGSLSANTSKDGILGAQFRIKYASTGTYGGSTQLSIDVQSDLTPAFP